MVGAGGVAAGAADAVAGGALGGGCAGVAAGWVVEASSVLDGGAVEAAGDEDDAVALLPPWDFVALAAARARKLRACGTPKHVLTSCAGQLAWSRFVSRAIECAPRVARNLLRACGDTTTAGR